ENRQIDNKNAATEHGQTPVTIGTNVSSAIASGTYRNELELTAVANPLEIDYSLTFNANLDGAGGDIDPDTGTSDTVSNLYSPLTASTVASSYVFTLPNPSDNSNALMRNNYIFTGWNTEADGTGESYAAGAEYTVVADDQKPNPGASTLYATWKPLPDFWKIDYMQDMTSTICNSVYTPTNATALSEPAAVMIDKIAAMVGKYEAVSDNTSPNVAQATLYDYRGLDGTGTAINPATGANAVTYRVRKLADGNCWMTQNIRLTLSTSVTLEVGTFNGGVASWTPNSTTSANAYNYAITPNSWTNISIGDEIDTRNGGNSWYYTWYGATAGQGTSAASPSITQSICPKGWRLPISGSGVDKSFYNLFTTKYALLSNAEGSAKSQNAPLDFIYAGAVLNNAVLDYQSGHYWSATPYASYSNYAYSLAISPGGIAPNNQVSSSGNGKNFGISVRCVSI
ncbi:hypothetical protein IJG91_02290, partial [Candidatus Saccharibacteria bacterium]|nr:hypothetical protein [Candidatus Saccharibacteria bacterium]